jgi:hypothetical protein
VQTGQETGQEVQVVHVVGDGPRGFFPGFFLFPLFLIGGFFLIGAIVRGGRRGHGSWGPGPVRGTTRAGAGSRSGPLLG